MHKSNKKRAKRARKAIVNYSTGYGPPSNELETDIVDMMTDLRHLCDADGLSYAELDRRACGHYCAEVQDPENP